MKTHYPVLVIGGGQAGLSMSYCLKEKGVDHLVFEKKRTGEAWRSQRWDSFCLVTPNWQCQLPGFPYTGPDPNGFMLRDEIVAYLESYAASFGAPVLEGVSVHSLRRTPTGIFELSTSCGDYTGDQVVVATGGYQGASIPRFAERVSPNILQIHSSQYQSPSALPDGGVLVVGTGQSGCQIAEDLHLAGRRTHLCVGSAPRTARRYRGRDVVDWLSAMGYYDLPVHEHPQKERVRSKANHYVTGRDGGRDIDLRRFALEGMQLYGRLLDVRDNLVSLGDDLAANLDNADAVADRIKNSVDEFIAKNAVSAPVEDRYKPVWEPSEVRREIDLRAEGITSIVWSMGFATDYRWIEIPLFDGKGYPTHTRGVTAVPGIYFLGLPWQYTWGSGRFSGVARDARYLMECVEGKLQFKEPESEYHLHEWALGS